MTRRTRMVSVGACAFALGMLALRDTRLEAQSGADVQRAVDSAYEKFKTLHEGKNADYIPALAKVDPNLFGMQRRPEANRPAGGTTMQVHTSGCAAAVL